MTTYYNYLGQAMPGSDGSGYWLNGDSGGGVTITAPPGPSEVSVNGGNWDTLIASQGDNTFYVNNVTDVVQAAPGLSGTKTIVSYSGGYTLPANIQNLIFYGPSNWGAGNSLDNLIIVGGTGANTLDGGPGNDVLVGGAGENDFQFEVAGNAPNHDVFYGFQPNIDTVRISGASFTSFAQIQAAMQQVGPDVVLTIDASDSITFRNMTIATFQPRDFLLPLDTRLIGAMTFDDEFSSLDLYNPATGQGQWQTTFGTDPTQLSDYSIIGNTEKQLYTHPGMAGQNGWSLSAYNPFSTSNGVLDITAGQFSAADAQHTWGQAYYSGMLNTRGLFMQKYGYFEMRAAFPTDIGSWPALWMVQDPYNGIEADVVEHLGIYPDVDYSRANDAGTVTGHTTYVPALSGSHDYGMLWTPTTTTFYIDEMAVLTMATPASWTKPMYMILDLALGGWGGAVDASALPAQMQVDWVHVYGLADNSQVVQSGLPPPASDPPPTGTSSNSYTATFQGVILQYAIGPGGTTVTGGPDAVNDALSNVQRLKFLDGYLDYSATDPAGQVYRLYEATLGRAPDQEGLTNWVNILDSGTSLQTVASDFVGSQEFQSTYGSLTNSGFVTLIYNNVLHRAPDSGGLSYWTGLLNSGQDTRAQVVTGFSESSEDITDSAAAVGQGLWVGNPDAADVARLYDTVFSRLPDFSGLAYWTGVMEGGASLQSVANGFVGSVEFQSTYGALNTTNFVTLLYNNVLHRAPDAGGLSYWTNLLDTGQDTQAQVVVGFSDSPEHVANTAPHIDSGIWVAG
jgi:beta-glucanase (GH16 family)